uniref:Uncharacterized protein n=1 Tax=Heterorhabditis bacteriophora TaxID=37862 RepID=A0A1I7WX62_HETBA
MVVVWSPCFFFYSELLIEAVKNGLSFA